MVWHIKRCLLTKKLCRIIFWQNVDLERTDTVTKCIFTFARYAGMHTWFHRCCTTLDLSVQEIADKWAEKDFFVPSRISLAETMHYSSIRIPDDASVTETSCFVVIYDPNHKEDIYLYKMEAY